MKLNKIYNLDCMDKEDGMPSVKNNSIDLIITDPPFGLEFMGNKYFDDSKEYVFKLIEVWIKEITRILKEHSHCYFYVPTLEIDKWIYNIRKYLKYNNIIRLKCYAKNTYIKNNYSFDTQSVVYASKGNAKRLNKIDFIKTSESWLRDGRNKNPKRFTYLYPSFFPEEFKANIKTNKFVDRYHINQKNPDVIKKFILLSSDKDDIVLDPFCGVSTICYCAKELGRKYIGYEINKIYYDLGIKILKKQIPIIKIKRLEERKVRRTLMSYIS